MHEIVEVENAITRQPLGYQGSYKSEHGKTAIPEFGLGRKSPLPVITIFVVGSEVFGRTCHNSYSKSCVYGN
jgi:hypothetical protein